MKVSSVIICPDCEKRPTNAGVSMNGYWNITCEFCGCPYTATAGAVSAIACTRNGETLQAFLKAADRMLYELHKTVEVDDCPRLSDTVPAFEAALETLRSDTLIQRVSELEEELRIALKFANEVQEERAYRATQ